MAPDGNCENLHLTAFSLLRGMQSLTITDYIKRPAGSLPQAAASLMPKIVPKALITQQMNRPYFFFMFIFPALASISILLLPFPKM
jgi:hypothetical protein